MRSSRERLKEIGKKCKEYRIKAGYKQIDIARDLGFSMENISAFETGRNDNALILLWYISHGMDPGTIE